MAEPVRSDTVRMYRIPSMCSFVHETPASTPQKPKLLNRVRQQIRARHCSRRTEKPCVGWIRRFIVFHGKRHPTEHKRSWKTDLFGLSKNGRVCRETSRCLSEWRDWVSRHIWIYGRRRLPAICCCWERYSQQVDSDDGRYTAAIRGVSRYSELYTLR